jgi:hypothetical protein
VDSCIQRVDTTRQLINENNSKEEYMDEKPKARPGVGRL